MTEEELKLYGFRWLTETELALLNGKTITVKNGVFLRNDVLAFYGNEGDAKTKQTAITIGSGTATNYVSFASATDSNVKVKCESDGSGGVKVTIGVYYK